jgi:hypothetical protein
VIATRRRINVRSAAPARPASAAGLAGAGLRGSRRLLVPLLLLLLAIPVVLLLLPQPEGRLEEYVLTGERSPACVRTVVLRDQSGSMVGFEVARDGAMAQLASWSREPDTLRADDEIAIIDFAAGAAVAHTATAIADLPDGVAAMPLASDSTELGEAIALLATLPATTCSTSLIALSDGAITPLSDQARSGLAAAGVTHVALVLPIDGQAPAEWVEAFPYGLVVAAPADDADRTANAVARAVASSVGQRLERR